jgi:DNA ligase-associated metallophosphoesterase
MRSMFIAGACPITFANESLLLLPDRAVYWPARKMLLLADVHLGKSASFRAFGLPVPEGSTAKDLSRITKLLRVTHAERLLILGDLIHAKSGRQPEVVDAIRSWREEISAIRITLVRGNHDRASGNIPSDWHMEEVEEPQVEDSFVFTHDQPCDPDRPTFAGHVHPMVHLPDYDGSVATAPCFVFDDRCAILPAFGTFTGGYKVDPAPGRRLFLVAPTRVIPLSTRQDSCV